MMSNIELKNAGLKVTLPRVKILNKLESAENHHMSAEDIYKELINDGEVISLATVYRVLTQFEAANIAIRHHFDSDNGQAVFELNHGGHHDHMVSLKTGKVVEFYDDIIENRQKEIAKEHNFKITEHSLILYGEFSEED
ncbi:MAG: ferric iron uptake transcriptional regulator [Gammaproteobacteria bacterium]|nr:ferric iron uptake transcriptional regulator [Gammaproteobacteria bacterium]MBT7603253.1 ferric iron uptake transcriptional regulator [Gammaproteobacteria bacterium]